MQSSNGEKMAGTMQELNRPARSQQFGRGFLPGVTPMLPMVLFLGLLHLLAPQEGHAQPREEGWPSSDVADESARFEQQAGASGGSVLTGYIMFYDYLDLTRALQEASLLTGEYPDANWFETDRGGVRFQLRAASALSSFASFDATLNIEYDIKEATRQPTSSLDDGVSVTFREGYISLYRVLPFLDLKIGRQFLFWSRFEWGGVIDVVSPWDFSHMSPEKENYRLAVDGFQATATFGPVNAELLFLPYFQPNRVPYDLPEMMGPLKVVENKAELPEPSIGNAEFGARMFVRNWNFGETGLHWFSGFNRTFGMYVEPVFEEGNPFPQALEFTPKYSRLQMVAVDQEIALGQFLIVGEVGYFHTEDDDGTDIYITNRHIKANLGFEWEPTSEWFWSMQAGATYLLDYDRQREFDSRVDLGEPEDQVYVASANQFQVAYKLQYRLLSELSLHMLHLVNIPDSDNYDMLLLLFAAWEPVQAVKTYLGAITFFGSSTQTRFGRLESQSRLFFELRHYF